MKAKDSCITSITKDCETVIIIDEQTEFTICGEVVNDELMIDSIGVVYYQSKKFNALDDNVIEEIKKIAAASFKELIDQDA